MSSLISNMIMVQPFHNINLSSFGPLRFFGKHPYSRPCPLSGLQSGTYFYSSARKQFLSFGIYTTGQIRSRIIFLSMIGYSTKYQIPILHSITWIIIRHIVVPIGCSARYLSPYRFVKTVFLIKVLHPYQLPFFTFNRCLTSTHQTNQPHAGPNK